MNNYDKMFFQKYLPEGIEMKAIIHEHIIVILNKIIINYFFGVILPFFLYYYSDKIKIYIPFFGLEIFLIIMFFKGLYDILDWYNDVWIVTNEGVVNFEWKLFGINTNSVKYESIEGIELIQDGFFDTILGKGNIIIHKIGGEDEDFILHNAFVPYEAINEIEKFSKESHTEEEGEEDGGNHENYEIIVKALSGVVEDYLIKSGYKKDDSEEKEELIKKAKRYKGTIDLSD